MKLALLYVLCIIAVTLRAQTVYTVRDGNWEDSSTWFNQIKPQTSGDSIFIRHKVSLHTNLALHQVYLQIDSGAGLCGSDSLLMDSNTALYNNGFMGWYAIVQHFAYIQNNPTGYIDVGDGGIYEDGGGGLYDTAGCIWVHYGPQRCLCFKDTTLNQYLDSSIIITVVNNEARFDIDSGGAADYQFEYGDRQGYDNAAQYHNIYHTYADTGYYTVRIIMSGCCFTDTLYTTVHIDSVPVPPPPPPPLPPPCPDTFNFRMGPNPADDGFSISRAFCSDEEVTIRFYTINGQLLYNHSLVTTGEVFTEYIRTGIYPSGMYIVNVQSSSGNLRRRVDVIHDY